MYEDIKLKFKDLENKLQDQKVISNINKLKQVSKEHAELKIVVDLILELEKMI